MQTSQKRPFSGDHYDTKVKKYKKQLFHKEEEEETDQLSQEEMPELSNRIRKHLYLSDQIILKYLAYAKDRSFTHGEEEMWIFNDSLETLYVQCEENIHPTIDLLKEDLSLLIRKYNKQFELLQGIKELVRKAFPEDSQLA